MFEKNKKRKLRLNNHNTKRVQKLCQCGKSQPSLNLPGETIAIWCSRCPNKAPNSVNVTSKKCQCGKSQPSLNLPGQTIAIWCSSCPNKAPNAVNIINKKCQCGKAQPSLNLPGETIAIWCSSCPNKAPFAVNIVSKKCQCGKARPSFNLPGETIAIWCSSCPNKAPVAVNLTNKKCQCGIAQPHFNLPGETIAIWCSSCPSKAPDSINVTNKKCQCGKARPNFNLPGETIAIWCSRCPNKAPNSVNVKDKKCQCGIARPSFNLPGETIAIWCSSCPNKASCAVNVKHKKCQCGKGAYYNMPGQPAKYCYQCRKAGMMVQPTKKCSQCKALAIFGQHTRERCEEHKLDHDFNLVEQICQSCGLLEILDNNNKCNACDPTRFTKYLKQKENQIRDFLIANKIPFTQDKIPNGSQCGKERPDFVVYLPDRVIIIEVDEDQHKNYQCECEQIRMINISQTFGGIPVFWIRFNPDNFKTENKLIKVSQRKKQEHLLDWLKLSFKKQVTHLVEVVYLFYDGCQETCSEKDIQIMC
jgi:hypothetical protein